MKRKILTISSLILVSTIMCCSCGKADKPSENAEVIADSRTEEDLLPLVEINLKDYVDITFEGYDTVGRVKGYGMKLEDMVNDHLENFHLSESMPEDNKNAIIKDIVSYFKDYAVDKVFTDLSNGEVVHFSLNEKYKEISNKYDVKINADDTDFIVSGLTELEEIDPFENMTMEFKDSRVNPGLKSCIRSGDFEAEYIQCVQDKSEAQVGEKIKVKYETQYTDEPLDKAFALSGYKATRTEMEFTVE